MAFLQSKSSTDKLLEALRAVQAESLQGQRGVNPFHNKLKKPSTLDEIRSLVIDARKKGLKIRVVGSSRSSPPDIILGINDPSKVVLLSLTKYRGVIVNANGLASVKAGTNLGKDPNNSDSTLENSFCKIVDDQGWALPIIGGPTHQTIGGYLQVGHAGGSLEHSFHDAVVGFTVVTGTGEVKTFTRDDSDPLCVAAGLFGIVTDIQIQLERRYLIEGTQTGYDVGPGGKIYWASLLALPPLRTSGAHPAILMPVCCGGLSAVSDAYKSGKLSVFQKAPIQLSYPIKLFLSKSLQRLAKGFLAFVWQVNLAATPELEHAVSQILSEFTPFSAAKFVDTWYKALATDNGFKDDIIPMAFTEVWVDPKDATKAVKIINDLHTKDGSSIGNLPIELYSAKKSPFWLSPAYTGPKIRIDIIFNQYNTEQGNFKAPFKYYPPEKFFGKYWAALDVAKIRYTTHWGKYRPDSQATSVYLKENYPKHEEWLALRAALDPDQIFVSPYWAKYLQIRPA
ncbi:hypothetical protein H0H92_002246 [Tricholoma furcatifolium]|nr:hypothetical protein H0H92_002246 [Tricholoma furcatifolium]